MGLLYLKTQEVEMAETANLTADNKGHGLLCPACKVDLVMSDRQGIEIDYCPRCRGVWLDRGELDKIIERSAALEAQAGQEKSAPQQPARQERPYAEQDRYYEGGHGGKHGYGRRRHSFLERLFD